MWNTDDRNFFYVGQANGNVMEFDIRNTSEHVQELNTEGIRSPVVSLQYIPKDIQAGFRLLYIHIHTHVTTKILLSYQFNLCFALHF